MHLVELYRDHCEWSVLPNLTRNRIDLTAFSTMHISLAAEIMSEKVACAFERYVCPHTSETVKFIRIMNKLFDCMNTRNPRMKIKGLITPLMTNAGIGLFHGLKGKCQQSGWWILKRWTVLYAAESPDSCWTQNNYPVCGCMCKNSFGSWCPICTHQSFQVSWSNCSDILDTGEVIWKTQMWNMYATWWWRWRLPVQSIWHVCVIIQNDRTVIVKWTMIPCQSDPISSLKSLRDVLASIFRSPKNVK